MKKALEVELALKGGGVCVRENDLLCCSALVCVCGWFYILK